MRANGRLRATVVLLLVASAALFAVGAAVERHHHPEKTPTAEQTTAPAEGSSESGAEGSSGSGGEHAGETHASTSETSAESEKLLGINPEAPGVVAVGVAASVLLALAVWTVRRRAVLVLAIMLGLAFAALDLRETVHQVHESRPSLIAVAIVLAVLHILVAVTAAVLFRTSREAVVTA